VDTSIFTEEISKETFDSEVAKPNENLLKGHGNNPISKFRGVPKGVNEVQCDECNSGDLPEQLFYYRCDKDTTKGTTSNNLCSGCFDKIKDGKLVG